MQKLDYTVESKRSVGEAVARVEKISAEKGFRVLHTHDVQATLEEKGFPREPIRIVEICNAKYASQVLEKDINIALLMPCPISVYSQKGKTYISAFRPQVLKELYPKAQIEQITDEVEKIVIAIVDEAK